MSFGTGINRLAQVIHWIGAILGILIGGFGVYSLLAWPDGDTVVQMVAVVAGLVIYGAGRAVAWILDGFSGG